MTALYLLLTLALGVVLGIGIERRRRARDPIARFHAAMDEGIRRDDMPVKAPTSIRDLRGGLQ